MSPVVELIANAGRRLDEAVTPDALEIHGLTVCYRAHAAVFSVDAHFPHASMTALIGPNGAGKSTLLRGALGLVPLVSGDVRFFGGPFGKSRKRVAYVPQRAAVEWDFPLRVLDVVLMGLYDRIGLFRPSGAAHRAHALACLARVGMQDFAQRQIGALSGGQRQRVFLARALARDADIYLLDEPFAGVDAATERAVVAVLLELKAEGRTVICVHHDLSTVTAYFDRALLLNRHKIAEGKLAEIFTPEALQATYGGRLAAGQLDELRLKTG